MASSTGAETDASATTEAGTETGTETGTTARDARTSDQGRASSSSGATAATPLEALRVGCLMNARYHASREAFLDTVHRWFMFLVIALGAVALIDAITADPKLTKHLKEVFAALAALIAALDLTFDLSNRARVHSLMKRRYFELLADVIENKKTLDEAEACKNRYSADEEPAYHALIASSWNAAQEMVFGDHADALDIPKWDRFLKNIWRFGGKQYLLAARKNNITLAS